MEGAKRNHTNDCEFCAVNVRGMPSCKDALDFISLYLPYCLIKCVFAILLNCYMLNITRRLNLRSPTFREFSQVSAMTYFEISICRRMLIFPTTQSVTLL